MSGLNAPRVNATFPQTSGRVRVALTGAPGPQGPAGAGSPDATTSAKGAVQLAGDLAGTAAAPTVPGLATKAGKSDLVYRAADYASVQAALDAAPTGSTVLIQPGNSVITTALSISKAVTLRGHTAFGSRIVANGCNGIEVDVGVSDVKLEGIEIASQVRHTTTANTLVGISVAGNTGSRPSNHVYRDVYVDGFKIAFQSSYLWASLFHNFRTNFGLIGMDIYGLSVNNFVADSQVVVAIVAGSRGIRLAGAESPTDATAVGSEGWTIHDSLIYGGEYGVDIIGNAHIDVHDNIIDFCQQYGVRIRDNGTNFGGNVSVVGNYIAMTGASGVAAIQSANTISHAQNTYNRISGNHLTVYSGSTCSWGINQSGGQGLVLAHGNTIKGFGTADIFLQSSENVIKDNACLSGMANAIVGTNGQRHQIAGNLGAVYVPGGGTSPFSYELIGGKRIAYGIAAPTVNTWAVGDRVVNTAPAVGSPKAWACTVAGTPGTWVSEGNL